MAIEVDIRAEDVAQMGKDSIDPVAGAILMVAAAFYSIDRTLGEIAERLHPELYGDVD